MFKGVLEKISKVKEYRLPSPYRVWVDEGGESLQDLHFGAKLFLGIRGGGVEVLLWSFDEWGGLHRRGTHVNAKKTVDL